jgi:hypothetical protein
LSEIQLYRSDASGIPEVAFVSLPVWQQSFRRKKSQTSEQLGASILEGAVNDEDVPEPLAGGV